MARHRLVLASGSPRRKELLEKAGFLFRSIAPNLPEPPPNEGENISNWIQNLAIEKATAVIRKDAQGGDDTFYLGSDTAVVLDGLVFGKPEDLEDAQAMLQKLSGKTHTVYTAWAILDRHEKVQGRGLAHAEVTWANIDSNTLKNALKSDEWRDKAGAYAMQGQAATWITKITGAPSTIVGLPVHEVIPALVLLGVPRWSTDS